MQEEMSAIQPKLVEASKEVDSSMAYVDKEQTEVSDLEKVVKGIAYFCISKIVTILYRLI